jgi:putative ABC transport system permease protein
MVIRALHRKLLRDLLSLRAQVLTTALLVICGVALLISSWSAYRSLKSSRDAYYREFALADVFSEVKRAPLTITKKIEKVPGVSRLAPRIVIDGLIDLGEREPAVGRFISIPSGAQPDLNRLFLREGRLPLAAPETEAALHEGFASANGIHLGDRLVIQIQGQRETVRVVGIAISPEYVYALSPTTPLPDDRHFGIFWMPAKPLERLARMADSLNSISAAVTPSRLNQAMAEIDRLLKPYGSRGSYGLATQPSSQFVNDEILQQRASSIVMPTIFLGVAAFLIQIISSRLVALHRVQIATLKSIGYTNAEVSRHYLTLIICMMLTGAIPGVGLGAALGQLYAKSYENFFRFPQLDFSLSLSASALGMIAGVLPGVFGAWASIRAAFQLPPAEAMRPPAPPAFHAGILERFGFENHLLIRQKMVFRNLLFHPMRLALSILGMATALAVVVSSLAWNDIIRFLLETQFQRAQREDISVTFNTPIKQGGLQELLHLPGVLDIEGYRLIPVRIRYANQKRELILTGWPTQARMRQHLGTDLKVMPIPGEGLLLTRFFEKAWGLSKGDWVEVEFLEGRATPKRIPIQGFTDDLVGIAASMSIQSIWKNLEEEPHYNMATLKIDPRQATSLYIKLNELPRVATVHFKSSLYRGFQNSLGRMMRVFTLILIAFALAIAVGVIYNSIRVSFSERSWELASLRVLGFSSRETFRLLLSEIGVQALLSLAPGCVMGLGLTHFVLKGVNTEVFGFPVIIERSTYALGILVVLGAFVLSAGMVKRMISRINLSEALKSRD